MREFGVRLSHSSAPQHKNELSHTCQQHHEVITGTSVCLLSERRSAWVVGVSPIRCSTCRLRVSRAFADLLLGGMVKRSSPHRPVTRKHGWCRLIEDKRGYVSGDVRSRGVLTTDVGAWAHDCYLTQRSLGRRCMNFRSSDSRVEKDNVEHTTG